MAGLIDSLIVAETHLRKALQRRPYTRLKLNYPTASRNAPRYTPERTNPAIDRALEAGRDAYRGTLERFPPYFDHLRAIPLQGARESGEAYYRNAYLSVLDSVALYCLLAQHDPQRYLEVGSGYSTRFARRAIRDHGLRTEMIAVDPAPRAQIASLCDEVLCQPMETLDLALFDRLQAGDILFIDNSHRCYMNSDVTACFLDVLPRLAPGVLVHLHDIFWPVDYPAAWAHRYYTEQYLLGALLANGLTTYDIVLPNHFISLHPDLAAPLEPLWASDTKFADLEKVGCSFWMRRVG